MDVLKYYTPEIDWERFQRGPLSDDVWTTFRDVLLLCHAYKYWKTRRSWPGFSALYTESDYQRRKRHRESESHIKQDENHKYRAAFLAAEKIWAIAGMVQERENTPDWHFSLALIKGVGAKAISNTLTGHERANFDVLAFDEFDANAEVSSDPDGTASRWREAAGYGRETA